MDVDRLISDRSRALDASGIRKVFELGATMQNPINLSIGQPDFAVPEPIRQAAVDAIERGDNGYSMTHGVAPLRRRIIEHLREDLGWPDDLGAPDASAGVTVTSGTSGALFLAMMALLSPGDEIIIPDPYFVAYPHMPALAGGRAVCCDTYPDFRMTAERIEPLITSRTKAVLIDSPANPTGVVMSTQECRDVLELCRAKGVLLISDEIYDAFTFADHRAQTASGMKAPSPAREAGAHEDVLVIRGFGKTYGCTGWRMGYAAGPARVVAEITKLQQYTYVCSPTPLQHACIGAFDVDMEETVSRFQRRRDMALERLGAVTNVPMPGGAFYAFVEIPEGLGISGQELFHRAVERNVLVIPGGFFSERDTHIRLSLAAPEDRLAEGLDILADLMGG
ncbi:MAG: pyridoxal phosphate-dependent aminotransferase [Planctomycetota bacterium]